MSEDVSTKEIKKSEVTTEEAKQALLKDQETRRDLCTAELKQLMEKHNCTLDVSIVLKANQVIPQVSVVAL